MLIHWESFYLHNILEIILRSRLVMNITELGAKEEMLEGLAESTLILDGGYRVPQHDEIIGIFRSSL